MFDVLVFLLETYQDLDNCPKREDLGRDLAYAGFESDEIDNALDWIDHLSAIDPAQYTGLKDSQGIRIYSKEESKHLPLETRGLIQFLEDQNGLTPPLREMLISKLLELDDEDIDLQSTKLIALMVLWSQKAELPILIGEELLAVIHGEPTMQ